MTKSFLEIAQEITDYCEQHFEAEEDPFPGDHCKCCGDEDNDGCPGLDVTVLASRLNRDVDLAIESILRREFGDSNGPALERKGDSAETIAAKIDSKQYIVL